MIICASPDGVSKKFDSVAIDGKVQALRVNTKTETHTLTLTHTHRHKHTHTCSVASMAYACGHKICNMRNNKGNVNWRCAQK